VHSHANPYWTAELYGKGVLGLREDDVCFSAAKLFFAYGLGNALTFPMSVGATTLLMAERPTPEATFKRWRGEVGGVKPTVFYGAPTGFAGMLAHPACPRATRSLRLVSSAGEALPARARRALPATSASTSSTASARPRCCTSSCQPARAVRYGTTGWPVPGYEIELRGDDGQARCPTASPATCTSRAPAPR
jgi:benzoate-CoA ligase